MLLPRTDKKFEYALKTALALAYVALLAKNRVKVLLLGGVNRSKGRVLAQETPFFSGTHSIFKLANYLQEVKPEGRADFQACIRRAAYKMHDVGTAILISDFLVEQEEYRQALSQLRFKNFDINVIHVLGEHERNPFRRSGKLKVRDIETQEEKIVYLSEANRRRYEQSLNRHIAGVRECCTANRAVYALASTGQQVEDFILKELPRLGLLH